jgi:hypothetical protein
MILYYIALSGRTFVCALLPKALSFQDVAIGLGYSGLSAQKLIPSNICHSMELRPEGAA